MNDSSLLLPPHFWLLAALCLLAFLGPWWYFLQGSRSARRRRLGSRIAELDAGTEPLPLDLAGMQQALAQARQADAQAPQGGRYSLYALPWFLFIGDRDANLDGLLDAAEEKAADRRTGAAEFWQWRFLRSMIAIGIAPRAIADPADRRQRSLWYRALLELAERRKRLALNGIVVCISARTLLGDAGALAAIAAGLRERADDCADHLRLLLPIYLVVTGLEQLDGYELVRSALPAAVLEQAVGHRVGAPHGLTVTARFEALFEELARRLGALRMALLREQEDPLRKLAAHRFVEQLGALAPGMQTAVERLFGPQRASEGLRWRGIYLTAAAGDSGSSSAFVWDLFAHFLPADQPLAHSRR